MYRFIFAFVLLAFSFNAANASGLLNCCDMGTGVKIEAKAVSPAATAPMPHCHGMGEKAEKKQIPQKANHCLCASMCASKIASAMDAKEFKAIAFNIPASYGEHDIAISVDFFPESPPPKI